MALGFNVAQGYEMVERLFDKQDTTNQLLLDIANNSGPGVQTLAITEREMGGGVEVDFPVEGGTRWLIPRLATGGAFEVPTKLVKMLDFNNRRLGGTITNKGDHTITPILASPQTASSQAGLGQIPLFPKGGSWDFRLGSLLWCGSVCAISEGEPSNACVVEV